MEHRCNSTGLIFCRFAIFYRIFLAILPIFDAYFVRQFMCRIQSLYFDGFLSKDFRLQLSYYRLLEHFSGNVQGQIFGVHQALDKAEIIR